MSIRFKSLLLLALLTGTATLQAQTVVVDDQSGAPLPKASIFASNGRFLNVTSDDGLIPQISEFNYPLTIRYVGYSPAEIATPDVKELRMQENDYTLPEVEVNDDRKILHLVFYGRDYSNRTMAADSAFGFGELITDIAVPIGKVKGFKGWGKVRVLDGIAYVHKKTGDGRDTLYTHRKIGTGSMDVANAIKKLNVPAEIKNGEKKVAVINGKYYPEETWRLIGDSYVVETDELADRKGHVYSPNALKALGMTTEINKNERNYRFDGKAGQEVNIEDITEFSHTYDVVEKGKLLKLAYDAEAPIHLTGYEELFIIDREYLTVEEAKELQKNAPNITLDNVNLPAGLPPLQPAIKELMRQASGL